MKTQPVNDHYIVAPTPRTAIEQFCGEKNFPLLAFTIRRYRANAVSDNPIFLAGRERGYEGMRMAGVPER